MIRYQIKNIIILESSYILYSGLVKSFSAENFEAKITRADDLEMVEHLLKKMQQAALIVSPTVLINEEKTIQNFRNSCPEFYLVAFTYQLFDEKMLNQFDAVINIFDTPEKISQTLTILFSADKENDTLSNEKQLSDREIEVLKQLAVGLSNKEIADKLNISTNTVITHRKNISQKTGIKSVSGLTIYAVVNNYISIDSSLMSSL